MNFYATCVESAASSLAIAQYPPIAPNIDQVVKLLPQPGHLVGRTQIMPSGTSNQTHKAKPQQILPKPILSDTPSLKQSVPRISTAMPQQTPLLINQPQAQSPTLLLNQVLTSGAPVLVQPAGPGSTVHLMLRTPTPSLQSGPGPPQNKMIIAANATQPQPQATVLIQNRQQVVRFMTAQGPMHLQQIQTPSGPQLIAIPHNQSLSFPASASVLVQGATTNALQIQQNSTNTLQLRQSPSTILQPNSFPQNSLSSQISIQNQIFQTNAISTATSAVSKRDEKTNTVVDNSVCLPGSSDHKKNVTDGKSSNKKSGNVVNSNANSPFNAGNVSGSTTNSTNTLINSSTLNNITGSTNNSSNSSSKKSNKTGNKSKDEEDGKGINKNLGKVVESTGNTVTVPTSTAQKNITSSLRQVRAGSIVHRNKQNQSAEAKEKAAEDANANMGSNLSRIIDCVASNTEHLMSPPKVDNLTATINSVAENIKSPTPDEIMSNLSLNDVFASGGKTLNLDKRPNLTIVPKDSSEIQTPEIEEPSMTVNRIVLSPKSNSVVDFENISMLEMSGITTSTAVQTNDSQGYILQPQQPQQQQQQLPPPPQQQNNSAQSVFQTPEDTKKAKKKSNSKKKGKKEENKLDLWDLMKSAGIGDDEFDEPSEINTFLQETAPITESLEVSASDSELLAQIQNASQVPGGIRVVVGEDGRPIIVNSSNVIIPDSGQNATATTGAEAVDADSLLQNLILQDNVFNFTPQAFATAQTQLNQLIQDRGGGLATSSADQQLLSQIFGATPSGITSSSSSVSTSGTSSVIQTTTSSATISSVQNQNMPPSGNENVVVNLNPDPSEMNRTTLVQKQETKMEFIGGPPPGLPPLGPDSLVITNNNGVPTLVASPALMQYLQTHQGIIQFQHDPVTKTIQPSLIIPHPPQKVGRYYETSSSISNSNNSGSSSSTTTSVSEKTVASTHSRTTSIQNKGTSVVKTKPVIPVTVEEQRSITSNNILNILGLKATISNAIKGNIVKFVRQAPSLLHIAIETHKLLVSKEKNKNMSEKEVSEVDKKIQSNRSILNQCIVIDGSRGTLSLSLSGLNKDDGSQTSEKTLTDLQNLDATLMKSCHPSQSINSPNSNSDFQAKFLESIGMTNLVSSKSTSTGTGTITFSAQSAANKRGRKKKANQATQADGKTEIASMTFHLAELTPEQNVRLNQAMQSKAALISQSESLDAIKQIIQEEVRKITSNAIPNANIRFTTASGIPIDSQEISEQSMSSTNVVLSNPNLNQILEQSTNQGNIISLQGNELLAINSANHQIFNSQNQIISGNHFVSSSNQILTISGNQNQLVSLGNPINSSNQIVTLGSPNLVSMNGNTVASPGAVIVGSNGNLMAIVHGGGASTQAPGLVPRIQAIQLPPNKQQHLKNLQNQIQTLSSKGNRTASENSTLQRLISEQQKILSSGKLVPALPGQQVQGMQIVSQPVATSGRIFQAQATSQQQQTHISQSQHGSQTLQVQQQSVTVSSNSTKANFTSQTVVSCGTNTAEFGSSFQGNIPKVSVPPTVLISDSPTSNYGPLYVSPNNSGKNVTKCEKGTSPIQIQMGTQTVTNMEFRSAKMSTGTMTSPNTGKPQAVVAPAIVIQPTEAQSPTYQIKPRNQTTPTESTRPQAPTLNRTAFIEQQMRTDQAGATMPDTKTPFLSKSDACKRLIRYHVMDEKALSPQDLATADEIFEATAQHLLDKFRAMKEKYKYLLMLESMREVSTAERIMVDRNFIIEERMELEELREKEKRLQEEFENPTITYSGNNDSSANKTDYSLDDVRSDINDFLAAEGAKCESENDGGAVLISKNKNNSDISSDSLKDNPFKLTEANRNLELTRMKSETKECKNTRTSLGGCSNSSNSSRYQNESRLLDEDSTANISSKCKTKSSRTFSDGSSKSSLDSSRDEDSGTDINAQVQSAIDSILNLQKCETISHEEGASTKRSKKKRKHGESSSENSKRLKRFMNKRERSMSEDSQDDEEEEEIEEEEEEGAESDSDPILDEAIRSILTS